MNAPYRETAVVASDPFPDPRLRPDSSRLKECIDIVEGADNPQRVIDSLVEWFAEEDDE